jgi:hypothetical protein
MPQVEYFFDGIDHRLQRREMPVVNGQATGQFPNPLNGIEFRAVWRHEFQGETTAALFPPGEMKPGMMIFDVIEDHNNMGTGMHADASEFLEKREEGFTVEAFSLAGADELSVPDAHSPKVADPLPCRMMQDDRIVHFRRYPHPAGRAMLLKPDLIHRPHVESAIMRQVMKFFYMLPAASDRHALSLIKVEPIFRSGQVEKNPHKVAGAAEKDEEMPQHVVVSHLLADIEEHSACVEQTARQQPP